MIIYGLGTCDTCRKARKALPSAEFVDVRADGMPADVLEKAFEIFGDKLLNTRSTTWRSLSEDERLGSAFELVSKHPLLMKRPLISDEGALYLGWTKDVQAALVSAD